MKNSIAFSFKVPLEENREFGVIPKRTQHCKQRQSPGKPLICLDWEGGMKDDL